MRVTINIDDELLLDASHLTGIKEKRPLVQAALEALIQQETAKRLAAPGGSEPQLEFLRRRPEE